jgi:cystine transport system permease protein
VDFGLIVDSFPLLLQAAGFTLVLTVVSTCGGIAIGLLVALCRVAHFAPLRFVGLIYVTIIRGAPLLIQLYFIYYALPQVGIVFGAWTAALLTLTIYMGAYAGEIIRAGIQAVDPGQMEASLSLGLSRWQALWRVILPQTARVIIPPLANQFITMLKESSLVSTITIAELTFVAQKIGFVQARPIEMLGSAAFLYLCMTVAFTAIATRVEKKLSY